MAEKKKKPQEKKRTKLSSFGLGKEKDFVVENLAMLLGAGIGISSAIDIVQAGIKSKALKNILGEMKEDIDSGMPLWKSFQASGLLPDNMVFLVKIGEASGRLPENLKIIATQEQKDRSFKSKVTSAMIYPAIVLGLTVTIGFAVAVFVLPKLASVFGNMNMELPVITKILIDMGNFLNANLMMVLLVAAIIVFVLIIFFSIPFTRRKLRDSLFYVPRIKDLLRQIEVARFGFIFGTLLEAGLPIDESLRSLEQSTDSAKYKKMYLALSEYVSDGNSIEKSLGKIKKSDDLIPNQIQQMVFAGERSGMLSEVLLKIDAIYEDKIDTSTKNLATVLEPIMLVIVWFGVLFIALAVIMPIYGLIGGLN